MSFLLSMLLTESGGTKEHITDIRWLDVVLNALTNFINPILIVVAVAGMVYAIVVGVRFAKADDKNAREEAKQKLIYVIVGIVATIILVALFYFFRHAVEEKWFDFNDWYNDYDPGESK